MSWAGSGATATANIELVTPAEPPPPPPPPGTVDPAVCDVPGITLLTDGSGDSSSGTPGNDLLSLQLAQPAANPQLLVFRINIDPGATPNPGTTWFASFNAPSG